jgi:Tfp pilus assembly protein PilP
MRWICSLLLCLPLWLAGASGFAQDDADLSAEDREAIQQVIRKQLDAFQRDDEAEAFSYAAPAIQARFKTPAEFMRMVRSEYEAVYRPRSTRFLEAFLLNGQVMQPLEVEAPDTSIIVAFYFMERQADGTWRISGCLLGTPEGQTT